MIGIYCIRNLLDGKCYVGQSVNIEARLAEHLDHNLSGYRSSNRHLQNAIKKYGIENFESFVVEECSKEELNSREMYWIAHYEAFTKGYNATMGGEGIKGFHHSEESNKRISEKAVARLSTPEARKELSDRAIAQMSDPAMRKQLSDISTNLWEDEEYRAKQDKAQKARWDRKEEHQKSARSAKKRSETPEGKSNLVKAAHTLWSNPKFREERSASYSTRKWMTNLSTGEQKFALPERFEEYLSQGFVFGRVKINKKI